MKVKRDDIVGDQEAYRMGKVYSTKRGQVSQRRMSQRNVIRSRGTAVRNQTRVWANRIMHVSAM
jgi:hypothetical protein